MRFVAIPIIPKHRELFQSYPYGGVGSDSRTFFCLLLPRVCLGCREDLPLPSPGRMRSCLGLFAHPGRASLSPLRGALGGAGALLSRVPQRPAAGGRHTGRFPLSPPPAPAPALVQIRGPPLRGGAARILDGRRVGAFPGIGGGRRPSPCPASPLPAPGTGLQPSPDPGPACGEVHRAPGARRAIPQDGYGRAMAFLAPQARRPSAGSLRLLPPSRPMGASCPSHRRRLHERRDLGGLRASAQGSGSGFGASLCARAVLTQLIPVFQQVPWNLSKVRSYLRPRSFFHQGSGAGACACASSP